MGTVGVATGLHDFHQAILGHVLEGDARLYRIEILVFNLCNLRHFYILIIFEIIIDS